MTVAWVAPSTWRSMIAFSPADVDSAWRRARRSTATARGCIPWPYTIPGIRPLPRRRLDARDPVGRPVSATRLISAMGRASPRGGTEGWESLAARAALDHSARDGGADELGVERGTLRPQVGPVAVEQGRLASRGPEPVEDPRVGEGRDDVSQCRVHGVLPGLRDPDVDDDDAGYLPQLVQNVGDRPPCQRTVVPEVDDHDIAEPALVVEPLDHPDRGRKLAAGLGID